MISAYYFDFHDKLYQKADYYDKVCIPALTTSVEQPHPFHFQTCPLGNPATYFLKDRLIADRRQGGEM